MTPEMPVVREPGFAQRVRAMRHKHGKTQAQCADTIGVTRQHWQAWEAGHAKPRADRMVQLATFLRCDEHWLRYGDNDKEEIIERVKRMMRVVVRDLDRLQRSMRK